MLGLVCVRSGVFIWTAHIPHISREDLGFSSLRFDRSTIRLMISIGKLIYLLEPPCLSEKTQEHPRHAGLHLSQASGEYGTFDVLEMAKEWPKQVLFNLLLEGQRAKPEYQHYLLDAAISLTSERLALICKKCRGHCFLSVVDYSKTSTWRSLWLVIMSRWNQCFLSDKPSALVEEIEGHHSWKNMSVFYYHNEEKNVEQIVLFSSRDGIEVQDFDSDLQRLYEWINISKESCFSFVQSKDRGSVISLTDRRVLIIDLTKKEITRNVEYSFGLRQWWESILDDVTFFGYSHCYCLATQECNKEHKLFLQDRLQGLFDVSNDGKTILIGWNSKQNRSLVLTDDKSEEQFRIDWDEARESLWHCSMLANDGKWLGFIDYEKLKDGDLVVCVVDTSSN